VSSPTDHAATARYLIREVRYSGYGPSPDFPTAFDAAKAQVHATLALKESIDAQTEQQRIANLIALTRGNQPELSWRAAARELYVLLGTDDDYTVLGINPAVAASLGIKKNAQHAEGDKE